MTAWKKWKSRWGRNEGKEHLERSWEEGRGKVEGGVKGLRNRLAKDEEKGVRQKLEGLEKVK